MILYFALNEKSFSVSPQEIEAVIKTAYPQCEVRQERYVAAFGVSLPIGEEQTEVVRAHIVALLAERGIAVSPCTREAAVPFAAPSPRRSAQKECRGIPLSAFLITVIALVLVFSLTLALVLGAFMRARHLGAGEQQSEDYVGKIAAIDAIFKNYYYEDTNGQAQLDAMLKAYAAASGDRYAAYYTTEEYAQMLAENNGSVVGIGITALQDETNDGILVLEVLKGSPAQAAGLLPGDVIVAVQSGEAQVRVTELGYATAVALLRGEEGSIACFTVLRDGVETVFSVARAKVEANSVTGEPCATDPTVGFVRITGFDTVTPRQFKDVMNTLIAGGCNKFIFDLRGNPGGDLKSVNAILSYFLQADQLMVSIVTKDGKVTEHRVRAVEYTGDYTPCSVSADEIGMYRGYPMAVLTNGRTASAAELFTAALRDYELATVIGETTYGKGVLQGVYSLAPWGYEGAVKLTTGYYNPPSGVNYDGVGIAPHMAVALSAAAAEKSLYLLSENEDDQRLCAISVLTATN